MSTVHPLVVVAQLVKVPGPVKENTQGQDCYVLKRQPWDLHGPANTNKASAQQAIPANFYNCQHGPQQAQVLH